MIDVSERTYLLSMPEHFSQNARAEVPSVCLCKIESSFERERYASVLQTKNVVGIQQFLKASSFPDAVIRAASLAHCHLAFSLLVKGPFIEGREFVVRRGLQLLSQRLTSKEVSQEEFNTALINSVRHGHIEIVLFLLEQPRELPLQVLFQAISVAANKGYLSILECLAVRVNLEDPDVVGRIAWAAAEGNQLACVQFLLRERAPVLPEDLGRIVARSAQFGFLKIIQWLLSEDRTIPQEHLVLALKHAVSHRHLDIVRFLLSNGRTVDEEDLTEVVRLAVSKNAAECGLLDRVQYRLRDRDAILPFDVGPILGPSPQLGFLEMIQILISDSRTNNRKKLLLAINDIFFQRNLVSVSFLLSDGRTLSQENVLELLKVAVSQNALPIVRFFLPDGRTISPEDVTELAKLAISNNDVEMVGFLLSNGRIVSPEDVTELVKLAISNNCLAIVNFLLSDERTVSPEELTELVKLAISKNYVGMVNCLFSHGRAISQEDLAELVKLAASKNHVEMVKCLLSGGRSIGKESLMEVIESALANDHQDLVEFLLFVRSLANADVIKMLMNLCVRNQVKAGNVLLQHVKPMSRNFELPKPFLGDGRALTDQELSLVVRLVASHGHLQILRFFLREGVGINQDDLKEACFQAASNGYLDVLKALLSAEMTIPLDILEGCVKRASDKNFVEMLEYLLQQGPISPHVRDQALLKARKLCQGELCALLERARTIMYDPKVHQTPHDMRIEFEAAGNPFSEVVANPLKYLKILVEKGIPRKVVSSRIPGTDLGGVTQQLITTLCEGLHLRRVLGLNTEGIPFVTTEAQKRVYEQLGRFASLIQHVNASRPSKFLTGDLLTLGFWDILQKMVSIPGMIQKSEFGQVGAQNLDQTLVDPEGGPVDTQVRCREVQRLGCKPCQNRFLNHERYIQDKQEALLYICSVLKEKDPALGICIDFILDPTLAHKNAYLVSLGEAIEEGDLTAKVSREDPLLKEVTDSYALPVYEAALSFLEGATTEFKEVLSALPIEILLEEIQGVPVTRNTVLSSLTFTQNGLRFSEKSQHIIDIFLSENRASIEALREELLTQNPIEESDVFEKKVEWLIEMIALEDEVWLKQLIFGVTSKKSMMPGMQLLLSESASSRFLIHTCFNHLHIPKGSMNKVDFKVAMNEVVSNESYDAL